MLIEVFNNDTFGPVMDLFESQFGYQQREEHHPEVDLFSHAVQVTRVALRETIDTDIIIAAMLHDVGKVDDSFGHERIGADMVVDLVSAKTHWLILNHMRIWTYILGKMHKLKKVKELSRHPWIPELVQLARYDKIGRKANYKVKYSRQDMYDRLNTCIEDHFALADKIISKWPEWKKGLVEQKEQVDPGLPKHREYGYKLIYTKDGIHVEKLS